MQLSTFTLLLAQLASIMASPVPEAEATPRDLGLLSREPEGVCSTGFTITTYGSTGCATGDQGSSNSGSGCSVCVEMSQAQSWLIKNPDHCATMSVAYYGGANCNEGNPTRTVTYDTADTACNLIPTDIGNHFSAFFVCLKGKPTA